MNEWDKLTELVTLHNKHDDKGVIKFIEDNMDNLTPSLSDAVLECIMLTPEYVKENLKILTQLQDKIKNIGFRSAMRFSILQVLIEEESNE